MDMGNYESLLNCSNFVRTIQERQNILVNSPHEISYRNGWIEKQDIENMATECKLAYFIELYKNIDQIFVSNILLIKEYLFVNSLKLL